MHALHGRHADAEGSGNLKRRKAIQVAHATHMIEHQHSQEALKFSDSLGHVFICVPWDREGLGGCLNEYLTVLFSK